MIPTELISLVGGSATGFLFRYMAQKSQDQKELFQQLMQANKQTTENQNQAAQRVPLDVGRGVRQLIVLSVLFATFLAPFVLPFFGVPTFVEVDAKTPEGLFGLFPETTKKFFVEVLAHEMVHHWQFMNDLPTNHGETFQMWDEKLKKRGIKI